MTSINAMRFNEFEGAMVCDEQRGWNDENLKALLADKIKSVVPEEMTKKLGIVAAYGNTGTSSIGDELRMIIKEAIEADWQQHVKKSIAFLRDRYTMAHLATITWQTIVDLKHRHVDEELTAKYGFTTKDFIAGKYKGRDGSMVEIKDEEIRKEAFEIMTWDQKGKTGQSLFLNGGILAGWAPASGFRIYHLDMMSGYYEEVSELFIAQGSGVVGAIPTFAEITVNMAVPDRDQLDRRLGVFSIVDAVNEAKRKSIGVGGYTNLLVFDGRAKEPEKRLRQFNDHSAKLASELVECTRFGYLVKERALELLDGLIYQQKSVPEVYRDFMAALPDKAGTLKFLRGYREKRNL